MVFLIKMDGYQKLCDTNKNVTEMSVIIKGVSCILVFSFFPSPFPLGFLLFSFIKFGMGSSHRHNHNASKQMILGGVRISDILKEKIKETFVKEKGISEKLQWFFPGEKEEKKHFWKPKDMKKECHIKAPNFGGSTNGNTSWAPNSFFKLSSNQLNTKNPNWKAEAKLKGIHSSCSSTIHPLKSSL